MNQTILDWSRNDPSGILAAAKWLAARKPAVENASAKRLMDELLTVGDPNPQSMPYRKELLRQLLEVRPRGLVEAVEILNARRDDVIRVMSRYGYTDTRTLRGYLDGALDEAAAGAP